MLYYCGKQISWIIYLINLKLFYKNRQKGICAFSHLPNVDDVSFDHWSEDVYSSMAPNSTYAFVYVFGGIMDTFKKFLTSFVDVLRSFLFIKIMAYISNIIIISYYLELLIGRLLSRDSTIES
jgi:hypothetical protein